MPSDDWIDLGWVTALAEKERHRELRVLLDAWLVDRNAADQRLYDDDVRVDLVYLGPGKGCDMHVWLSAAAAAWVTSG